MDETRAGQNKELKYFGQNKGFVYRFNYFSKSERNTAPVKIINMQPVNKLYVKIIWFDDALLLSKLN